MLLYKVTEYWGVTGRRADGNRPRGVCSSALMLLLDSEYQKMQLVGGAAAPSAADNPHFEGLGRCR